MDPRVLNWPLQLGPSWAKRSVPNEKMFTVWPEGEKTSNVLKTSPISRPGVIYSAGKVQQKSSFNIFFPKKIRYKQGKWMV